MVIPNCTPFPTNLIVANNFSKSFKKLRKKKVSFSLETSDLFTCKKYIND